MSIPSPAFLSPRLRLTPTVVTGGIAALAVVLFGLLVARTSSMTHVDSVVSQRVNSLHTGVLGSASSAAYVVFGPVPAIAATVLIAAVIWIVSRKPRLGVTFGIVVAVTWLSSAVVKAIVGRLRPDPGLLQHPFHPQPVDASYPSGHAVFVTALVMAFFLLARGRRARPFVGIVGGVLIALVASALVIDGVHFTSDVIASIIWAVGLAPLVLEVWNRIVVPLTFRSKSASRAST